MHLLRCLDTLVLERHVTRAADRMGMSQSGMSAALARLRTAFDDPILVRTPQGMQLSEHALEIAGAVRRALNELDLAIAHRGSFDPACSSVAFSIMASDYVGVMLLPPLLGRLRREAPNISLKMVLPQPNRVRDALANSECDMVVGILHDLPEGLYQMVVAHDTLGCVVRTGHPHIDDSLSLAQYTQGEHIYYGTPPSFIASSEVLLERTLPALGIERRIAVHIPSLAVMPRIIASSDLLATIPAKLGSSFSDGLPLQVLPLPFRDAGLARARHLA